jgi:hypothetical protein
MILHGNGEGIIAQPHLLDDIVEWAPRFDFETVCDPIDRLMVRAVYFFESMLRGYVVTQRLNVLLLLFGEFMPRNVEPKRSAERDIQDLDSFANAENRQTARERLLHGRKFPAITRSIDTFFQYAGVDDLLAEKFRRYILPAGQKQPMDLFHRDCVLPRIIDVNGRMLCEKWVEPLFIFLLHPCGEIRHARICDFACDM